MEGSCCALAKRGYSGDGKKGKLQIVYGLLCAPDGCPGAIEVFEGDTGDTDTVADQVAKQKRRLAIDHVVLVGDGGMITQARIDEDLRPAGLDWITALRAPALQGLVGGGYLQMSLFDERDMAAITSPDFPGERLIVCRNPDLARERGRKREDLLAATERDLAKVAAAVARKKQPLRGAAEIGMAVGVVLDKHKMAKHFNLTIEDARFVFARKSEEIAQEAALDGLYAVRTSLPEETLADEATVKAYKSLSMVERAFRCLKTVTCMSGRSIIGSAIGFAPTCSCACWPIMSSGICGRGWPRCSTTTTTEPPPKPCATAPSPRRNAPPPLSPRAPQAAPRRRSRPLLPNPAG